MKATEKFYAERDLRTLEYTGLQSIFSQPIHVQVSPEIFGSAPGQILILSLLNQLSRVHRNISISINPAEIVPLLIPGFFSSTNFVEEVFSTMRAIDPYGAHTYEKSPVARAVVVCIGDAGYFDGAIFIGAKNSIATIAKTPQIFELNNAGTARGAALAACLGAAAVFQSVVFSDFSERKFSIWNFREGEEAELGPESMSPINIGKILVVGLGAIGSGLCYWAKLFGENVDWHLIEKDVLKLHNTNRGLTFFPQDTDWFGGLASDKIKIAEKYLKKVTSYRHWYHEVDLSNQRFDVILCLANEFSVRKIISYLPAQIYFQATTGKNWLAQLHRHIPKSDDCIFCRTGEIKNPTFGCSGVQLDNAGESSDAALPFLSGLSSLMLTVALQRAHDSRFIDERKNDWRMDLKSNFKMASSGIRKCKDGCPMHDFWLRTS